MSVEETVVERVNVSAIQLNATGQIERSQIDAQIATAHNYPKHTPQMLSKVKANMMTFATLDEETAESCFYTLPRGGKNIQGPSVRMAEIGVSCYGNVRVSVRVAEIDTTSENPHVMVQAVAHDLEQNVAVSMEKRRRITKKKSKNEIDEDDINLAVNACAAIGFRDAAFKVIPQALIKPVWQAAKRVAIGDIKSLSATRDRCIDRLKQMGVPIERILSTVKCAKIEDIGQPELEVLFGLGTALKDGDTTIEEAFPLPQKEQKMGTDALADRLSQGKQEQPKEPPQELQRPPEAPQEKPKKTGRPKGSSNKKQEKAGNEQSEEAPASQESKAKEAVPVPKAKQKPKPADKYKCLRCERTMVEPNDGGKCVYCFGDVSEIAG